MGWKMSVGGIDLKRALTDKLKVHVVDQLDAPRPFGSGVLVEVGDPEVEGAEQFYWSPGVPVIFTRLAIDPREFHADEFFSDGDGLDDYPVRSTGTD